MIFGRTSAELKEWRRRFALLPILLNDGRVLWLQHYHERWRRNAAGFSWLEQSVEPYSDPPAPTTPPPLIR
ncbi:MAG: hypothetical protein J0I99_00685 [Devosia sp.]|uniref:hypothetical protein n=1 Tax=Devosia sp. TaxID=1871048 RepID=UPI001AC6198A|nr:hypothetical protein [Devosia sp.]MBN9314233.1 hypothetical protein [Devosia sp.]